ncbi:MAG: ABC transporter permease [Pseudomonadota bacterium]|nr:MAG: ABC transporter permease [Pseudomonadota bacterium]
MSLQTHTPPLPPPDQPLGPFGRVVFALRKAAREPNPVWIRELKQSARLPRTPIILAVVTGIVTLLIASIGGVLSVTAEPAQVGTGVFHTFFSLAFAIVTSVGPAVAAATVASEKSGRTWEALLLTGLSPAGIARGKFLAALTYVSLYVVMLAPVGALSFLFGGVTPAEVLLAFAVLLLIASLSVAFGLAVSSKLSTPTASILVTLFVGLPLAMMVYGLGGVALSFAVHELWPGVTRGGPVWLPTAYVRADFGLPYVVFLVLAPLLVTVLPAWLFYEVTIANMASESDDRSTRLRLWMLVSAPPIAAFGALAALAIDAFEWVLVSIAASWFFFVFVAFLVAGEPLGPSPRVVARWQRARTARAWRALGPGVGRAGTAAALAAVVSLGGATVSGVLLADTRDEVFSTLALGSYAAAFAVFLIGFCVWTRARAQGATAPRVLALGVLFAALFGPYIAMAIAGILTQNGESALLIAAPSPAFAFVVADRYRSPGGDADLYGLVGAAASSTWALLGIGLLVTGALHARRRYRAEHAHPATAPAVASSTTPAPPPDASA